MRHSKQEILDAVRKRAEIDLFWEGEQLSILDVYIEYESDLRLDECTVLVKWKRSDVEVETDDAIYTLSDKRTEELDIWGPEWWEYPLAWKLHKVI